MSAVDFDVTNGEEAKLETDAPVKRRPGRPKKSSVTAETAKRPGRPKKADGVTAKRPGRPKKADGVTAKRPGRPKKADTRFAASKKQMGGDHYLSMNVQPWDVVSNWDVTEQVAYYRGNAIKYLMRLGTKEDNSAAVDAEKALHYVQRLTEVLN